VAALVRHPLIDEILDARREYARGDTAAFEGYRNHAHRVYNYARSISSLSPNDEDRWRPDYPEPSIEEAARYLRETGREEWDREVALMIALPSGPPLPRRARQARRAVPPRGLERLHHGSREGRHPAGPRKAADAERP
jgi:hypothetical protein